MLCPVQEECGALPTVPTPKSHKQLLPGLPDSLCRQWGPPHSKTSSAGKEDIKEANIVFPTPQGAPGMFHSQSFPFSLDPAIQDPCWTPRPAPHTVQIPHPT